jgi:hypothetical protein
MPEADGPLLALGNKLSSLGLPSLSVLIAQISDTEGYVDFLNIVHAFLPEREQEILHESTPAAQVARFASYFEDRYFPLEPHLRDGDIESYEEVTSFIPVIVAGMSWEDYEAIPSDYRPASQLMTYLVADPFEEGTDVALAEACEEYVPKSLLERVAENRLEPQEAHRLLDGTRYEALAKWASRIHSDTGNFFLDTDYEMLMSDMPPDWDIETVNALTREWQQADAFENTLSKFFEWLEGDLPGRFGELVNFILEKKANERKATRRTKSLPVGVTRRD